MRRPKLTGILLLLLSTLARGDDLATKIETLIQEQLPQASVGILVKDAETGKTVYSRNARKLLAPASSIKLLTAAAALIYLKPDYKFQTTLSKKNNDIYLTFSGAPSLTIEQLSELLSHLKNQTIQGNFIIDASKSKPPYYPDGTSYDDLGWYYSAPDTAIILDENMAAYDFISNKKIGSAITIKSRTPDKRITIINDVKVVSVAYAKKHCNLNIEIKPANTLHLYGCLGQYKDPKYMRLAVPDPFLLAKNLIIQKLIKHHIQLKGKVIFGKTPEDAQPIASQLSDDLVKLITHMLLESDNIYAGTLTKELGYALTGDGTYKQGAFAIKKILSKHAKLDFKQIKLADGVGTRYNLTTPEQFVNLLSFLYANMQMREIFIQALPQMGVTGTLADRMSGTALEKQVYAKTGSMQDMSSLSGYLYRAHKNPLIFSIIINNVNKPVREAKSLEESILLVLNEH